MTSAPPGGDDFGLLADSYRKELLAFCYRMLGSAARDGDAGAAAAAVRARRARRRRQRPAFRACP